MTMRLFALLALAGCGYDFDRFRALEDGGDPSSIAPLDAGSWASAKPAPQPSAAALDASDRRDEVTTDDSAAGAARAPRFDAAPDADAATDAADEGDGSSTAPSGQAPQEPTCPGGQSPCREPLPEAPQPQGLRARYDFAGSGSAITDSVGGFHGALMNAAPLDGSGSLTLDGADDFVDLPDELLQGLRSLTVVAWVERFQDVCWQRLFDFGGRAAGEPSGAPPHSLYLTMSSCPDQTLTAVARRDPQRDAVAGPVLPRERPVHVAVTFDGDQRRLRLHVDGVIVGETPLQLALADLLGPNNWLGRSQWPQDAYAQLRYEELRIYDRALDSTEIATLHGKGPDAP